MNACPHADASVRCGTPSLGKRRQPAQVGENFRQAQPLALVVERPMASSPPAVDERAALPNTAAATGNLPALPSRRAGRALAPTFDRQRATTRFSSLTFHPEEPCHASQSL